MQVPPLERAAHLALVLLLTTSLAACTHDNAATPTTTSSPGSSDQSAVESSSDSASTAGAPKIQKANARLHAQITHMRGGVKKSRRAGIARHIAKPIRAWIHAAYLHGDFPRGRYTVKAFPGWTSGGAALARHDKRVTTNAALSKKIVNVVADRAWARLYVFAVGGRTGGATARILVRMTAQERSGHRTSFVVSGVLYLTRKADRWRIFGYDLHRTVLHG